MQNYDINNKENIYLLHFSLFRSNLIFHLLSDTEYTIKFTTFAHIFKYMKYLIVGLGNIGKEYENTRHNIGFMALDFFAQSHDLIFESDRYATSAVCRLKGRRLVLIKPTTYMNLSGKAVRYHLEKHKIPIENLLIITDDKDLPMGSIRLKPQGSGGTHNGLNDIIETINTSYFSRLRMGIGSDFSQGYQVEYVLGTFKEEETNIIKPSIEMSKKIIESFALQGVQITMNTFNKKIKNKGSEV